MADAQVVFETNLDESGLKRGLSKLGASSQGLMAGIGAALGATGATLVKELAANITQYVDTAISTASRLQEVQNVVDVTFGESASSINAWAKAAKDAYGMGELKAKQYTSTIGAMFKSMGMAESATLEMSKGIGGLTGDMASFYNLDYDTAFEKLRAGISGETEPLKQLGINMSVANLEAFALSNGIKKSYEKMSQAEQVTLRYNYLMQVTADAQGDFARTSDGYANQQRILATTQEELAATIGEILLPVAVEATKILNTLVGGLGNAIKSVAEFFNPPKSELDMQIEAAKKAVDDFNGAVDTAGKNLNTNLAAAKATQATAMSLLKNYEDIQSKNVLTENDTAQLRTIARQIVSLYPDMGKEIDSATGLFNVNTTAVKDNITALADQQKAVAYYAVMQEYQTALLKANVVEQMAADAYQASWDKWQVDSDALSSLNQIEAAVRGDIYAVEDYAAQLIAFNPSFQQWFDTASDGSLVLNDLGKQAIANGDVNRELENTVTRLTTAEAKSSKEAAGLYTALGDTQEQTKLATEQNALAAEKFNELGGIIPPVTEAVEDHTEATDKATEANADMGSGYRATIKAMADEMAAAKKLKESLRQLSDDTIAQIKAQIDGFEKIKKVRPKSAKQTTKDVNSQTKYMQDYAANFKKAQENGLSTEALAELATVTDENAATLAGLAKASDTEIANFNAAIEARNTERTSLATQLSDFLSALVLANTTLDASIQSAAGVTAPETVTAKIQTVETDGKTAKDGIAQSATEAVAAKDSIKTSATEAQDAVSGMVSGIATIVDDNAETLLTAGAEITGEVANGVAKNDAIETVLRGQVVRGIAKARGQAGGGKGVGEAIVNGIGTGAQSKGNWLNQILQQIVRDAINAAKSTANSMTSKSLSMAAQSGLDLLANTLLGRLSATGLSISGIPGLDRLSMSAMGGFAGMASGGASSNTTITEKQEINFNYPVQAPDEVARAIRRQRTYGLAGMRK